MERLLSPKEVSEAIGVSVQTLNVWRCTKRYNLPFVKMGRLVKYRSSDVAAFIDRNHHSTDIVARDF